MGMYYDLHTEITADMFSGYDLARLDYHNVPKWLPFVRELTNAELDVLRLAKSEVNTSAMANRRLIRFPIRVKNVALLLLVSYEEMPQWKDLPKVSFRIRQRFLGVCKKLSLQKRSSRFSGYGS